MRCAHTMKATALEGFTYCCDCGKRLPDPAKRPRVIVTGGRRPAEEPAPGPIYRRVTYLPPVE